MEQIVFGMNLGKLPREPLATYLLEWLTAYEEKRREPGADDLGHESLVRANARHLAYYVAPWFDDIYARSVGDLVKQISDRSFAAGLGKPMPIITLKREQ
jgi:hypothetical protein